ncbi:hypothetical protein [Solibacillus ferritrahens]|uniref:hypothetical protein n=1 Tax=Solibacillus ferritrahens TaxID=3098620 RepID=UPI00300B0C54
MNIIRIFESTTSATENINNTLLESIDSTIDSYYAELKVNSTTSSQQEDVQQ